MITEVTCKFCGAKMDMTDRIGSWISMLPSWERWECPTCESVATVEPDRSGDPRIDWTAPERCLDCGEFVFRCGGPAAHDAEQRARDAAESEADPVAYESPIDALWAETAREGWFEKDAPSVDKTHDPDCELCGDVGVKVDADGNWDWCSCDRGRAYTHFEETVGKVF